MRVDIGSMDLDGLLDRASRLDRRILKAQGELTEVVRLARAQGASWGDLGYALGVSRQAAQQRFGAKGERAARVDDRQDDLFG